MIVWHTLCNIMHPAPVYNAFLERAWHLTPTSPYFPDQYRDIATAARENHTDQQRRGQAYYANPYAQLKALDETAKKLRYALQQTNDAKEISKLVNSQVRTLGAMFVLIFSMKSY